MEKTIKSDLTQETKGNGEDISLSLENSEDLMSVIAFQSVNIIDLFMKIWYRPERVMLVSEAAKRPLIARLSKLGWVKPKGRIGNQVRWSVNDDLIKGEHVSLMKQILGLNEFGEPLKYGQ